MAIPFLSNINMNKNEIQNLVLHTQNSDPTGTEGQIYYNSSTNKVLIHNGSSFINISGDITEVIAGNGLTGGGTTGTGAICELVVLVLVAGAGIGDGAVVLVCSAGDLSFVCVSSDAH